LEKARWTFPGEGQGELRRILEDLMARGYAGGLSIEPHLAVVAHDPSVSNPADIRFSQYVEYGRRLEGMLHSIGASLRMKGVS
jgi:sugar phosphate isomerase/epimerase